VPLTCLPCGEETAAARTLRANRLHELPTKPSRTTSPDLEATMAGPGTPITVDELLAQARAKLPHRPSPAEALRAQARGALLVDIRGDDQRRDGLIPGAIVVPRNCLEWRCDPASEWRHPAITGRDLPIILVCHQGYQSSLAAATLQQLGLINATDLDGGFTAWTAAGLPVIAAPTADQDPPLNPASGAPDNQ
jgi:rhodanese-related sulfurtransferase